MNKQFLWIHGVLSPELHTLKRSEKGMEASIFTDLMLMSQIDRFKVPHTNGIMIVRGNYVWYSLGRPS